MKTRTDLVSLVIEILIMVMLTNCSGRFSKTIQTASPARENVRVAIVPPGFSSPFHIAIRDGAISEAQRLGWRIDVVAAEEEGDFVGQVTVVEQELQKGVDAIAINPIDVKAIVTAVNKANNNGTPVFMQNTITPVDQGEVLEYIGYDQWHGAAKLARYTCELFETNGIENGKVYILMGIRGFHANRRTQGYEWGLQQYCPEVMVVGKQTAEWNRTKAIDVTTAALQQNPDINLFYGNSDEMGIGACIAAQKIGRIVNQDVWCISIDGNPVTLDLIEKGETTATLGVYPTLMGVTVIQQMEKALRGDPIPYILETPSIVVDQTNLRDYRFGSTWTEPVEGKPELDNGRPTGVD
ncbi:MAG: sugar ABC transporter substrate-binding protein [Anaerolineales bacterium]|nr:sugar ABC transporter substrate-binding protein [Anaerolineales bacterium]